MCLCWLLAEDCLTPCAQWNDAVKQYNLALKLATDPEDQASFLCERSRAYAK